MSAREPDFIQAILAAPDDEATRLVYADWLEERDDPRAELIRTQMKWEEVVRQHPMLDSWHWETCRISIWDGGDWGRSRSSFLVVERDLPWMMGADEDDCSARVQELLVEHGEDDWAGAIAPYVTSYEFRRGLLERVKVSLADLREHAEELFRQAPILDLTITQESDEEGEGLADVLALPALSRLTHLHLTGPGWGEEAARALAGAKHIKRLTSLWLEVAGIGDKGLALLANAPHLRSLTELHLEYNNIGLPGIRALASSPYLNRLRHLYLGGNDLRHVYRGRKGIGPASFRLWQRGLG
jgi:uncharacterized protein (TIGR02996 family)